MSLRIQAAVRGYPAYQTVWKPQTGDFFVVLHEPVNRHDRHAMAVYHEEEPGTVVGHLPREISRTCRYFSKHEGKIRGKVTCPRKYSAEAGGMEIPCELTFTFTSRNIEN